VHSTANKEISIKEMQVRISTRNYTEPLRNSRFNSI